MKIINVKEIRMLQVETDLKEWPTFRGQPNRGWEQLMGESWEPAYFKEDELDLAYAEWKGSQ